MGATNNGGVAVVVVTFNSAALLPDFFTSLRSAVSDVRDVEVVVADNASTDGSSQLAQELWPGCKVVQLPENRGYAAGINAAARAARPFRALLVLNDDIRLHPGSVRLLLEALSPPDVAITVPVLKDSDGALLKSLKRRPSPLRVLGEALMGGDRAGRFAWLGEVVQDPAAYTRSTEAAWASGCAWMISRECWEANGPWDETFFLYAEETEYALRCSDAGYRLRLVPEAQAIHLVGPSHENPRLWAMSVWNRYRLYRRRHGPLRSAAFWLALVTNELSRSLLGRSVHRAGLRALLARRWRPVEVR